MSLRFRKAAGPGIANDRQGGVAEGETYLPEELVGTRSYEPTERGYEKMIAERLARIRQRS
jgi:putative ATPase